MASKLTEKDFERKHRENVELYVRRIQRLYNKLAKQSAYIAAGIKRPKLDKVFSFDDYKAIEDTIQSALKEFHDEFVATIRQAITVEFALANTKNDYLVRNVLSDQAAESKNAKVYFERNNEALKAFRDRKIKGLNLSDRVWQLTDSYKNEIELALDNSIKVGRSANASAKDVQKFLKEPDKLFRRVRNDKGELKLSKAAKNYNPGQGVYRSSFKNAQRLTRSETNQAYQVADYERIQKMNFVVGIRVNRSNNPFDCPICNYTSNKNYPSTFKFRSWHPNCRCFTTSILMSDDEIDKLNDYIIEGKPVDFKSVNNVDSVPPEFTKWVKDNKPALLRAKSVPLFISDNNISLG